MWKFIKMLIGIGLLPLAYAASVAVYALYESSIEHNLGSGWEGWALPVGFLLWVAVFFVLPRPVRTYVLGHELTHALWALLMGGRAGKMKIGKSGGHIELTRTNFIITLAPYFFPFYTVLVIAIYYVSGIWLDVETYRTWWLGAVGFSWSFHLTFTLQMLSERQPDIQEHGRIFSYLVIYIMNLLVISSWMIIVGTPHFASFGELLIEETAAAYTYAWGRLTPLWSWINGLIQSGT
jgi:hypothetical protein